MHFIVGYNFIVQKNVNSQQKNTRILTPTTQSFNNIKKDEKDFEPGKTYSIYFIKPEKDKVFYYFSGPQGIFLKEFSTIKQAEELISQLSNTKLPNYKKIYETFKN